MRPHRDMADAVRLAALLRKLRPDAVFSYFIKPVIYGSLAARMARVPRRFALMAGMGYVFTPGEPTQPPAPAPARRWCRASIGAASRPASASSFTMRMIGPRWSAPDCCRARRRVLLSGTGVDLDRFPPAPPVLHPLRFLLIARLLREKGIEEYVEAARSAAPASSGDGIPSGRRCRSRVRAACRANASRPGSAKA